MMEFFFYSPPRPDWLWGPPSSYSVGNGGGGSFLGGKAIGTWSWPLSPIQCPV